MEKAHGFRFPAPNSAQSKGEAQIIWFGKDTALLIGPEPDSALNKGAAVTDQSDAWASVILSGAGTVDTLARLVPVDLRPEHFGEGQTLRSLLGHMSVSITSLGPDRFLVLVFRSMAVSLVEELKEAMEAVEKRNF